jgi:hypothetical protein
MWNDLEAYFEMRELTKTAGQFRLSERTKAILDSMPRPLKDYMGSADMSSVESALSDKLRGSGSELPVGWRETLNAQRSRHLRLYGQTYSDVFDREMPDLK